MVDGRGGLQPAVERVRVGVALGGRHDLMDQAIDLINQDSCHECRFFTQ